MPRSNAFVITRPSIQRPTIRTSTPNLPGIDPSRYLTGKQFAKQISMFSANANIEVNFNTPKSKRNKASNPSGNDNNSNGGNGGNGSGRQGRPHEKFSQTSTRNSKDPQLSPVSFKTNIASGTLVNPFQESTANRFSDLFIMNGELFGNLKANSNFSDIITKEIYYFYLTSVQRKVNTNVFKTLTQERIYKYFSDVCAALQLYYQVESILAYNLENPNTNRGMTYLRNSLTSDILSKHEVLKEYLVRTPIPKRLMEYVCYLYSNFRFSSTNSSAIYRLGFRSTLVSSSNQSLTSDYYEVIIDELLSNHEVMSLLLKTFKDLENPLTKVTGSVVYDEQFLNFWRNSCVTYLNSDNEVDFTKTVSDEVELIDYFQYSDEEIDGAFYALSSIFNTRSGEIDPGIWRPVLSQTSYNSCDAEQTCSLLCYCNNYKGMANITSQGVAGQSGLMYSVYFDTVINEYIEYQNIDPRNTVVQVNSLENLGACVASTVKYLFSIDG